MRQDDGRDGTLGGVTEKWQELAARRERNGVEISELARIVGIRREQLGKILSGKVPNSRALGRIERALDELEAEAGRGPLVPNGPEPERVGGLVKFHIHGIYGAAEVVVEGPVENLTELREQVDKLLRGEQERNSNSTNDGAGE